MFLPDLVTGIEQSHEQAGLWIYSCNPGPFVFVAERTGEPQICFYGRASQRPREEMIYFHRRAHDSLLGKTVAAAMSRLIGHTLAQALRNVG
jgi:hypothetical protein